MMQTRTLALLAFAATLAGCASAGADYPSLAVRDGERVTGSLEVPDARPYVPTAPGAPTLQRMAELAGDARAAHQQFLAAVPTARTRVSAARGSGVGSESWAVAQVALADLESQRSRVMIALADLDLIYVDASTAGESLAEIGDTRSQIAALVETQDATIGELLGQLAQ